MWDIRTINSDDADLFRARVSGGFGRDPDTDEAARERFEALFEFDRTFAAFDGEAIVGTAAAFSLGVTVPGGAEVPMGGTTIVTVQPTHRRRGILRQLMSEHLDEIAGRGEPLAGLWASEGSIYGRFGYGLATQRHKTVVAGATIAPISSSSHVSVRLVDKDAAAPVMRSLYEQKRSVLPGMLTRSQAWWSKRVLADVEAWRGGKSALRFAIFTEGDIPTGYAMFRQDAKWDDVAAGEIEVEEMITISPVAHRALWDFLINIDLFPKVEYWNLAVDDPLAVIVSDSRRVQRKVSDSLWIRVIDVAAALSARRYETNASLVLEVVDPTRPTNGGTYRLLVEDGLAMCERTSASAEVTLDIDVLGALYLGGGNALAMASARKVHGDSEAVGTMQRMFATNTVPWCPYVF